MNSEPYRKEFKLIVLSEEPLIESDIELIKDALALASGAFDGKKDGLTKQTWLLEEGSPLVELEKIH